MARAGTSVSSTTAIGDQHRAAKPPVSRQVSPGGSFSLHPRTRLNTNRCKWITTQTSTLPWSRCSLSSSPLSTYAREPYDAWDAFVGFVGLILAWKYACAIQNQDLFQIFLVGSLFGASLVGGFFPLLGSCEPASFATFSVLTLLASAGLFFTVKRRTTGPHRNTS